MNPFLRYWLPLIAYCILIFIQSHAAVPVDLPRFPQVDKILHAGAYGLLGILFYRAYRSRWPHISGWALGNLSLTSAALYGLSDEIHQYFVPTRTADPLDVVADAIGAALGVLAYHLLLAVLARRSAAGRGLTKHAGSVTTRRF